MPIPFFKKKARPHPYTLYAILHETPDNSDNLTKMIVVNNDTKKATIYFYQTSEQTRLGGSVGFIEKKLGCSSNPLDFKHLQLNGKVAIDKYGPLMPGTCKAFEFVNCSLPEFVYKAMKAWQKKHNATLLEKVSLNHRAIFAERPATPRPPWSP